MTDMRARAIEALNKHMPSIARSVSVDQAVLAVRAGDGRAITPEVRDELLAKLAANDYLEVEVDLLAYEQKAGVPNRKFLRFRDGLMARLGASSATKPFLRNHDQADVMARAGTILSGKTEKRGDGDYAILQTVKLVAPWAVDHALRGLVDRASIGWHPNAMPHCTVCKAEVFSKCFHWPGDRLAEEHGEDGRKRLVRRSDGDRVVEWEFGDAEITETSFVNVPAVPGAGIRSIRASLSAELGLAFDDEELTRAADAPVPDELASDAPSLADEPQEPTMPNAAPAIQQPTEPTTPVTPAANTPAADHETVRLRVEQVLELQGLATKLGVDADEAKKIALDPRLTREKAGMEILKLAAKAKPAEPVRSAHRADLIGDEGDKRKTALGNVMLDRMLSAAGSGAKRPDLSDEISKRFRRKTLLQLAEESLQAQGLSTSTMDPDEIAERALSSTSTFPLLLADVGNKFLLPAFESRRSPWYAFAREVPANDFKQLKFLRRSGAPKAKPIPENGAIKFESFGERQETGELETYGVGTIFSRKMIINDDLGAFATQSLGLVDSINDNRDDIVVGIFLDNVVMADGYAFFSNEHNNLVTTTGAPSVAIVEEAEDVMSLQTQALADGNTRQLNMTLDSWFGARKEASGVDKLVNPRYTGTSDDDVVGAGTLGQKVWWDNRLAVSPRYYYGLCAARTGLVYGGLRGSSQPRFSQAIEFATEGVKLAIRDDFYAGLDSWEWAVRVTR